MRNIYKRSTNLLEETEDEILELERLLKEAKERYRRIAKVKNEQTWYDWVWEKLGY